MLDKPVSNSGRLKTLIAQLARENNWPWEIRLTISPDAELSKRVESNYAQTHLGKKMLGLSPTEIRFAIQEYMNEQKFIHAHTRGVHFRPEIEAGTGRGGRQADVFELQ